MNLSPFMILLKPVGKRSTSIDWALGFDIGSNEPSVWNQTHLIRGCVFGTSRAVGMIAGSSHGSQNPSRFSVAVDGDHC